MKYLKEQMLNEKPICFPTVLTGAGFDSCISETRFTLEIPLVCLMGEAGHVQPPTEQAVHRSLSELFAGEVVK